MDPQRNKKPDGFTFILAAIVVVVAVSLPLSNQQAATPSVAAAQVETGVLQTTAPAVDVVVLPDISVEVLYTEVTLLRQQVDLLQSHIQLLELRFENLPCILDSNAEEVSNEE